MADPRKQKLIDLRPVALTDALLNLAIHSDEVDSSIEQLHCYFQGKCSVL